MEIAKAKEILKDRINQDGKLYGNKGIIYQCTGGKYMIDGRFTGKELTAIATWIECSCPVVT